MTESHYFWRKLRGVLSSTLPDHAQSPSRNLYRIPNPSRSTSPVHAQSPARNLYRIPNPSRGTSPVQPYSSSRKLNRILLLFALVFLTSCYSVRIVNKDGIPEPDPLNNSENFYKGKKVHVLDTTISLKLTEGEFHLIERCATGGFYSFEYRVTFGGVLLSAVTFGKKRRVRIKYVCLKEQN